MPDPPHRVLPGVPEDLSAVTMGLLQKSTEARFQRAGDVIAALLACRDAPRDGRGEMVRLLTERFPGRARPSGVYAAVAVGSVPGSLTPAPGTPVHPLPPGHAVVAAQDRPQTATMPPDQVGGVPPWGSPMAGAPYGSQLATGAPPVRRRRWPSRIDAGVTTASEKVRPARPRPHTAGRRGETAPKGETIRDVTLGGVP